MQVVDLGRHQPDVRRPPFQRRLAEVRRQGGEQLLLALDEQALDLAELAAAPLEGSGEAGGEAGAQVMHQRAVVEAVLGRRHPSMLPQWQHFQRTEVPMFESTFPIISTPDLPRALAFYRGLLDGTISYQFPPEGEPGYVSIEIGSSQLGIGHDPAAAEGGGQRFTLWVYAEDCDVAVERLRAAGVPVIEEPVSQPWGERVARVSDPDGNVVIIGSRY